MEYSVFTMKKTVDIPDDRRIHLDLTLPADFPVGKAEMRITVTPFRKQNRPQGVRKFSRLLKRKRRF